jgi:hypothetical protein
VTATVQETRRRLEELLDERCRLWSEGRDGDAVAIEPAIVDLVRAIDNAEAVAS